MLQNGIFSTRNIGIAVEVGFDNLPLIPEYIVFLCGPARIPVILAIQILDLTDRGFISPGGNRANYGSMCIVYNAKQYHSYFGSNENASIVVKHRRASSNEEALNIKGSA
jgi:hypothetical protein